jgi:hypothetical protein
VWAYDTSVGLTRTLRVSRIHVSVLVLLLVGLLVIVQHCVYLLHIAINLLGLDFAWLFNPDVKTLELLMKATAKFLWDLGVVLGELWLSKYLDLLAELLLYVIVGQRKGLVV